MKFYLKSLYWCYNENNIENRGTLLASEVNTNKIVPEIWILSYSDLLKTARFYLPTVKQLYNLNSHETNHTWSGKQLPYISVAVCQNPVVTFKVA